MSNGISDSGFDLKEFDEILDEMKKRAREEFGQDVNLDEDSVLGQILGVSALQIAEVWEAGQQVYEGYDPSSATGDALDNIAAFNLLERKEAQPTTGEVDFLGERDTLIPDETEVSHSETGTVFVTDKPAHTEENRQAILVNEFSDVNISYELTLETKANTVEIVDGIFENTVSNKDEYAQTDVYDQLINDIPNTSTTNTGSNSLEEGDLLNGKLTYKRLDRNGSGFQDVLYIEDGSEELKNISITHEEQKNVDITISSVSEDDRIDVRIEDTASGTDETISFIGSASDSPVDAADSLAQSINSNTTVRNNVLKQAFNDRNVVNLQGLFGKTNYQVTVSVVDTTGNNNPQTQVSKTTEINPGPQITRIGHLSSLVPVTAKETGPKKADPFLVDVLDSSPDGIDFVNNPGIFAQGRNRETDRQLRIRREESLALGGRAVDEALESELSDLDPVDQSSVINNRTENVKSQDEDGNSLAMGNMDPHSFRSVIWPILSSDDDARKQIARTIFGSMPAGIEPDNGTQIPAVGGPDSLIVTDDERIDHEIQWVYASKINIGLEIPTLEVDAATYPDNGDEQVRDIIENEFDIRQRIGEDVLTAEYESLVVRNVSGIIAIDVDTNSPSNTDKGINIAADEIARLRSLDSFSSTEVSGP